MYPCSFKQNQQRPITFLDYTVRHGPLLSSRKTIFSGESRPASWAWYSTVQYRGQVASVEKVIVRTVLLLIASVSAWAQPSNNPSPLEFHIYHTDEACSCINTKAETSTIRSSEKVLGKIAVQIFSARNGPEQELFRVKIGKFVDSDMVKWWNYGIADEGDFNGDGAVDYAWYGGDDTSFVMYLFISSDHGYARVDVLKTLDAAWKRRFHRTAPDLTETGGEYAITDVVVRRAASGLTLVTRMKRMNPGGETEGTLTFKIEQAVFNP